MAAVPTVRFAAFDMPATGVLVVLAGENAALPERLPEALRAMLARGAAAMKFKGKSLSSFDLLAPTGTDLDRVVVVGTKGDKPFGEEDWLKIGGTVAAKAKGANAVAVWCEVSGAPLGPDAVAAIAAGIRLRGYQFDRYKTKKPSADGEDEAGETAADFVLMHADEAAARTAFA